MDLTEKVQKLGLVPVTDEDRRQFARESRKDPRAFAGYHYFKKVKSNSYLYSTRYLQDTPFNELENQAKFNGLLR